MACCVAIAEHPTPLVPLRRRIARAVAVLLALCAAGGASVYVTLPGVGDAAQRVAAGLRVHGGTATSVPLPGRIATAVVAVEDERYWRHGAIDPLAIARAAAEGIAHPGRDGGGSTIAQQLAKVLYL